MKLTLTQTLDHFYEGRPTKDEFLLTQKLLGHDQLTPPKKQTFAYARLFRCGVCGLSVTVDKKTKPSGNTYTYYRCTRRHVTPKCIEPSIEEKALESQISGFVERITIPKPFYDWLCKQLSNHDSIFEKQQADEIQFQISEVQAYKKQLNNLTDLKIRNLITDAEFLNNREKLQIESSAAQERLEKAQQAQCTFEPIKILTFFLFQAKKCFEYASNEDKRKLLQILCSNPQLKARKALLTAKIPFGEYVIWTNLSVGAGADKKSEPQIAASVPYLNVGSTNSSGHAHNLNFSN